MNGWSFVIITDGKDVAQTNRLLESIRAQDIPDYEIILVGKVDEFANRYDLLKISAAGLAERGKISSLRNIGCANSLYSRLVVLDDDYYLHPGWYEAMVAYGDDWKVLSCRIECPDGSRYWDWKTYRDSDGNHLIPYDDADNPDVSISGGLILLKADVFSQVQWDDNRGFYEFEDVDYSNRLKQSGYKFKINPSAVVTHDGPYSSRGSTSVWRTDR